MLKIYGRIIDQIYFFLPIQPAPSRGALLESFAMAQLTYTTQNGEQAQIHLPAIRDFTVTILWYAPGSAAIRQKLDADLQHVPWPEETRAGDHIVYCAPDRSTNTVVIIQSAKPAPRGEKKPLWAEAALLFHRTRRDWLVVATGKTQLWINGEPHPSVKLVREGMLVRLGDLTFTFHEVDRQSAGAEMSHHKPCPFCGDHFVMGEEVIRCPSCDTLQHALCWDENGGRCSGPAGCPYGLKLVATVENEVT